MRRSIARSAGWSPISRAAAVSATSSRLRPIQARASRAGGGGRRRAALCRGGRGRRARRRPGGGGRGSGRAAAGQLVGDEPAVGADVEALEGRAAVGGHRGQGLDHRRVRERPRRPAGGLGAPARPAAPRSARRRRPRRPPRRAGRPCRHPGPWPRSRAPARSPRAPRRSGGRPGRGRGRGSSRLDRVGSLAVRRRVEQAADVVEQRGAGPRPRRSRRCRGRRGRASCGAAPGRRGRGSAPRRRRRAAASGPEIRAGRRRGRGRRRAPRRGNSPSWREATKTWSKRPARSALGSAIRTLPSTGPLQARKRSRRERAASSSGRAPAPSSAQLGQRGGDRCRRPQLDPVAGAWRRPVLAPRIGREAIVAAISPTAAASPAGARGRLPHPRTSSGSSPSCSSQSSSAGGGGLTRGRGGPCARTSRPARAGRRRGLAGSAAGRPPGRAEHRLEQGDQRPADRGRGDGNSASSATGDPVGLEHRREQRAAAGGVADGRSRSPPARRRRRAAAPPPRRSPRPRRARPPSAAGRGRRPAASAPARGAEAALEVEEERASRVAGVGLGPRSPSATPILAQALEQRGAGRSRAGVPLLVRQRDGDLGGRGERADQVELVAGQVVEAVDEDRPAPPGGAPGAEQGDRPAGDGVRVDAGRGGRGPSAYPANRAETSPR